VEVDPPDAPRTPDLPVELDTVELGERALHRLHLERVALRRIDLAERVAPDLRITESLLEDVMLDGVEAAGLRLADVRVERGSWSNLRAVRGSLTRVEARGLRGTGVDLAEAELRDLTFTDCRLDLASFRFATLARVAFRDCRLDEADFHGATLSSVRLERCQLTGVNVHTASFSRGEIRECNLERIEGAASLAGVRMTWPDVVGVADSLAEAIGIAIVE
jgi:uncharacterized protein YjbI with pentapeptide repeats